MRIAEIYQSLQGEGSLTGVPSVFVRASGCNLRCWFCDTPFASWSPEGEDFSVDEIVALVLQHPAAHVVITGGEPMLFAELLPLTQTLHAAGKHITIETAGTLFLPVVCDLMSISPKLSNSAPPHDTAGHWHARHERPRHSDARIQMPSRPTTGNQNGQRHSVVPRSPSNPGTLVPSHLHTDRYRDRTRINPFHAATR